MSLELAVVVDTHPDDNSVDAVLVRNGGRLVGAQVAGMGASGRTGSIDLPEVKKTGDKWDITQRDKDGQDVIAVIGYVGNSPIVLGFLTPQISQMTFDDKRMKFSRHQSDVMSMIDGDGNIQLTHPSGAYVRIGETPDSVDLAGKNADKNLKADRNTDKKVHVRIGLADDKVVVTLTPDGDVRLEMKRDLFIEAEGKADIKVTGNVTAEIGGNLSASVEGTTSVNSKGAVNVETDASATVKAQTVTLDTPQTTCTGNLEVQGALSYAGGMTGSGGGGAAATFDGPTEFNGSAEFNDNVQVNANLSASGSITDGNGDGGA